MWRPQWPKLELISKVWVHSSCGSQYNKGGNSWECVLVYIPIIDYRAHIYTHIYIYISVHYPKMMDWRWVIGISRIKLVISSAHVVIYARPLQRVRGASIDTSGFIQRGMNTEWSRGCYRCLPEVALLVADRWIKANGKPSACTFYT